MSSQSVKQTPARTRSSGDVDFERKMATISPRIFSPDLRHSSTVVRAAVYRNVSAERANFLRPSTHLLLVDFVAGQQVDDLGQKLGQDLPD